MESSEALQKQILAVAILAVVGASYYKGQKGDTLFEMWLLILRSPGFLSLMLPYNR